MTALVAFTQLSLDALRATRIVSLRLINISLTVNRHGFAGRQEILVQRVLC